ncbi:MAG: hypothetical protein DRO06_01825, partial [Thermoproteota archaeon]
MAVETLISSLIFAREGLLEPLTAAVSVAAPALILSGASGQLTRRRAVWLAAVTALPAVPLLALGEVWRIPHLIASAVHVAGYLRSIASDSLGAPRTRVVLSSLISAIAGSPSQLTPAVAGAVLAVAAACLTEAVVGRVGGPLLGIRGMGSVRALTGLLLTEERAIPLAPLGERRGTASVAVLGGGRKWLVCCDVHPGPIGRAGSSEIPSVVLDGMEAEGLSGVYLRRTSTHARNLSD